MARMANPCSPGSGCECRGARGHPRPRRSRAEGELWQSETHRPRAPGAVLPRETTAAAAGAASRGGRGWPRPSCPPGCPRAIAATQRSGLSPPRPRPRSRLSTERRAGGRPSPRRGPASPQAPPPLPPGRAGPGRAVPRRQAATAGPEQRLPRGETDSARPRPGSPSVPPPPHPCSPGARVFPLPRRSGVNRGGAHSGHRAESCTLRPRHPPTEKASERGRESVRFSLLSFVCCMQRPWGPLTLPWLPLGSSSSPKRSGERGAPSFGE